MNDDGQAISSLPEIQAEEPAMDRPNDFKRVNIAVVFALPFALLTVVSIPAGVIIGLFNINLIYAFIPIQVLGVYLPTLWLYRRYRVGMIYTIAPGKLQMAPMAFLLLFLAGFLALNDTLTYYFIAILPEIFAATIKSQLDLWWQMLMTDNPVEITLYVLFVAAGAGFFEEILFRGLLLRACMARIPAVPSIILNGLFFGVLHGSALMFTYYMFIGIMLSVIAYRTGTLLYGIIFHVLMNLSIMLMSRFFFEQPHARLPIPAWIAIFGGLFAMVVGFALFIAFTKKAAGFEVFQESSSSPSS